MIQTSGIIWMECGCADHLCWSYNLFVDENLPPNACKFKSYSKNTIDVPGLFIAIPIAVAISIPLKFLLLILNFAKLVLQRECFLVI